MPNVSVVIVTRNRPGDLSACLKSLNGQAVPPSQTVIIDQSDGASRNRTRALADANGAEYYFLPEPNSVTRSRNFGIGKARGGLVLFLDDDVELEGEYMGNMLRFFEANGNAAGMTGVMTNFYKGGIPLRLLKLAYKLGGSLLLIDTPHLDGYEVTPALEVSSCLLEPRVQRKVGQLWGANMCIRAGMLEKEKFDGRLREYSWREDTDLCTRLKRHGELWIVPKCRLTHNVSSEARLPKPRLERLKEVYDYYLLCKNSRIRILAKLAYWYSRIGVFLYHAILTIIRNYPLLEYVRTLAYVARNAAAIERGETEEFLKPDV